MVKTTFKNQGVLRNISECCLHSNMDCRKCLCFGSDNQEKAGAETIPLHNSTDFEYKPFRENAYQTSVSGN